MTALDQAKKERVFKAAKELFAQFGFRKTTVDEIAERAGISKRTMYEVFSSKEKILAELVLFEARSFRRLCLKELNRLDDPVEKIRMFLSLSANYFDENPFLGQVLADEAGLFTPFLDNEINLVEDGIRDIAADLLKQGVRQGIFRGTDTTATVQCVMVMFRGFTYYRTAALDGNAEWVPFILRAIAAEEEKPVPRE